MAIWRSLELEALFGGPLDTTGITNASIQRLVAEQVRETDQLDFKGQPYTATRGPSTGWTSEQELAKDVAALANHRGGVLLVGVEESNGFANRPLPFKIPTTQELEDRRLRQALINWQAPLVSCSLVWVTAAAGGWFLAIVVPPSVRQPHAVLADKNSLRYPVRHGSDTTWLSESEVAERYRRRVTAQQEERARVKRVVEEGSAAVLGATGIWLYVAVVPEVPVPGRLDRETVRDTEEWHREWGLVSPLEHSLRAYGRGIPAPGRVTFTGSQSSRDEDETDIREAYLELHVDGAAFAATPIADRTDDEGSGREVGEIALVDDSILLVDVGTRWCARQTGAWGTATILTGLVEAGTIDGAIGVPIALVRASEGGLRRFPGTRLVRGHPNAATVADLTVVGSTQQRLAITYQVLSGLLQWFGLAEPTQLRPNGHIVPSEFLMTRYRQVQEWARRFEVEADHLPGAPPPW